MPNETSLTPEPEPAANGVRLSRLVIAWMGPPGAAPPPFVAAECPLSALLDRLLNTLEAAPEQLVAGDPPKGLGHPILTTPPIAVYLIDGPATRVAALVEAGVARQWPLTADALNAALERRTHLPQAVAAIAE